MDELDAHVVVHGELVALEHGGPVEAVWNHAVKAVVADTLTQRAAREDLPVQADGREEGAEEDLCVRVAVEADERHPGAGLLGHLRQGVVLQQVGQHHLLVADVLAQAEVAGDVDALWTLHPPAHFGPLFVEVAEVGISKPVAAAPVRSVAVVAVVVAAVVAVVGHDAFIGGGG